MLIQNNGLTIRSAVEKDAEILTDWWNDGKVMEHAGFPKGLGTTVQETLDLIKQNKTCLFQRCIIESEDTPIGETSYAVEKDFAQIGIKICERSFQNKGLGSALLKMLIDFLFCDKEINEKTPLNKIILDTNKKNVRAQHVYEKLGFKKVRENINSWQDQLGVWQTSIDYELTRDEAFSKNLREKNK